MPTHAGNEHLLTNFLPHRLRLFQILIECARA